MKSLADDLEVSVKDFYFHDENQNSNASPTLKIARVTSNQREKLQMFDSSKSYHNMIKT